VLVRGDKESSTVVETLPDPEDRKK